MMGWITESGTRCDRLIDTEIEIITGFSIGNYYYSFANMSQIDRTSVLMKLQQVHDCREFNPYEIHDYLSFRKIKYSLSFVIFPKVGFWENFKHLKVILHINIYKLRDKLLGKGLM